MLFSSLLGLILSMRPSVCPCFVVVHKHVIKRVFVDLCPSYNCFRGEINDYRGVLIVSHDESH